MHKYSNNKNYVITKKIHIFKLFILTTFLDETAIAVHPKNYYFRIATATAVSLKRNKM